MSVGFGTDAYVTDVLQSQVVIGNPFEKVGYPVVMEDLLRDIGPSFAPSLGAALRTLSD